MSAATYWQQGACVFPKGRFFGLWVNNMVCKHSKGKKKNRGDGEPRLLNLNGTFKCCLLFDDFYLLFKSSGLPSHFLLHQAVVDITMLQYYPCFLYFFLPNNCFLTFASSVFLFCRSWAVLREFSVLSAQLCPRADLIDLFHTWKLLFAFSSQRTISSFATSPLN